MGCFKKKAWGRRVGTGSGKRNIRPKIVFLELPSGLSEPQQQSSDTHATSLAITMKEEQGDRRVLMPSPWYHTLSISRRTPFLTSSPKIHWGWLLIAGQSFSSNKCTCPALPKETRPEMQTRDVSPPATARSIFPTYDPENGPVDHRALLAGVCATAQSMFILFCLKIYSSSCRKTRHRFR